METKTCEYCSMEIPGAAKICPHCRKSPVTWTRSKIIFAVLFVGIVMFIIFNNSNNSYGPAPVNAEAQQVLSDIKTEAVQSGLVKNIRKTDVNLTVYVNRRLWESITVDMKKSLVEAFWRDGLNDSQSNIFYIKDHLSDKTLATADRLRGIQIKSE